jgi:hypothetical protein
MLGRGALNLLSPRRGASGGASPPAPDSYLLREDGSYLLREDGSKFVREA